MPTPNTHWMARRTGNLAKRPTAGPSTSVATCVVPRAMPTRPRCGWGGAPERSHATLLHRRRALLSESLAERQFLIEDRLGVRVAALDWDVWGLVHTDVDRQRSLAVSRRYARQGSRHPLEVRGLEHLVLERHTGDGQRPIVALDAHLFNRRSHDVEGVERVRIEGRCRVPELVLVGLLVPTEEPWRRPTRS